MIMRSLSRFPLDDDVIHRILGSIGDFGTLRSYILSCKSVFSVFQAHPNSITLSVAYNVAGPTLPQALGLARCSETTTHTSGGPDSCAIDANTVIRSGEARILERNASVVRELEDLFSFRHKDRTSKFSKLSIVESTRFQRGLYRIWMFTARFPAEDISEIDEDDQEAEIESHKAFLNVFSAQDLCELERVFAFLVAIIRWTCNAHGLLHDNAPRVACIGSLVVGQGTILERFRQLVADESVDYSHPILSDYLSLPLSLLFSERDMKMPEADNQYLNTILDSVNGGGDQCCRCEEVCGAAMWNETNWDFLKGEITPGSFIGFLQGRLPNTYVQLHPLRSNIHDSTYQISTLMNEIYDLKVAHYSDWKKQDWLCLRCVTKIIQDHLLLWCADQQRQAGASNLENCWYGYNCRTQVHNSAHAAKLNHLCEPTRGDAL